MYKTCLKTLVILLAMAPVGLTAQLPQNPLDAAAQALERHQMERLSAQQQRPGITIDPFKSDGCSGGMSQAWSFLADTLPPFAEYIGDQPPWEHCCLEHDQAYWRGESDNGVEAREHADSKLRACVQATGVKGGAEIAQALDLPQQQIVDLINLTGELMYQAVRLGGAPCTGLAWRWGHGWPSCSASLESGNQI